MAKGQVQAKVRGLVYEKAEKGNLLAAFFLLSKDERDENRELEDGYDGGEAPPDRKFL